jgi:hypothetical protein
MAKKTKKKVAKKNTTVVEYDGHGNVAYTKICTREDAKKYCIRHNIGSDLIHGDYTDEDKKLIETIEKLIKKGDWKKVFKLWDELPYTGTSFHRGADWY